MKREEYLTWDEYFMGVAKLTAMRSKDPSTQVGSCIVSLDNRLLSTGYNGAPNGFDDDKFPWNREGEALDTKYFYVCHAERNAILNFRGDRKELKDAKLYVLMFPCNECAKDIIQAGIKEIVYLTDKYIDTKEVVAAMRMFDECGVKYKKLDVNNKTISINL